MEDGHKFSLPFGQLYLSSFPPTQQSKAAVRSEWEPLRQNYFSILPLSLSPSFPGCWQSSTGTEAQLFSFSCVFSEPPHPPPPPQVTP